MVSCLQTNRHLTPSHHAHTHAPPAFLAGHRGRTLAARLAGVRLDAQPIPPCWSHQRKPFFFRGGWKPSLGKCRNTAVYHKEKRKEHAIDFTTSTFRFGNGHLLRSGKVTKPIEMHLFPDAVDHVHSFYEQDGLYGGDGDVCGDVVSCGGTLFCSSGRHSHQHLVRWLAHRRRYGIDVCAFDERARGADALEKCQLSHGLTVCSHQRILQAPPYTSALQQMTKHVAS